MADYPDFTKPYYSRKEFAAKIYEIKSWAWEDTVNRDPDTYNTYDLYTIPSGKELYLSDFVLGAEFMGVSMYRIKDGVHLYAVLHEPWDSKPMSLSSPVILKTGEILQRYYENRDTVAGKQHGTFLGFETLASKPEKPKNDDPEELYRTGEFNYCNIYFLEDNEQIFIFNKIGEDKRNCLTIKDYGLKNQKKLASFHLKHNEASEIIDIIHTNPKKVKEVLAKYERKYGKKQTY